MNRRGGGLFPRLENDMQTVPTCALRGLGHHSTSILLINEQRKKRGKKTGKQGLFFFKKLVKLNTEAISLKLEM